MGELFFHLLACLTHSQTPFQRFQEWQNTKMPPSYDRLWAVGNPWTGSRILLQSFVNSKTFQDKENVNPQLKKHMQFTPHHYWLVIQIQDYHGILEWYLLEWYSMEWYLLDWCLLERYLSHILIYQPLSNHCISFQPLTWDFFFTFFSFNWRFLRWYASLSLLLFFITKNNLVFFKVSLFWEQYSSKEKSSIFSLDLP